MADEKIDYSLKIEYVARPKAGDWGSSDTFEDVSFSSKEEIQIGLAKLVGKYIRMYDFADEFLAQLSKELGIDEK